MRCPKFRNYDVSPGTKHKRGAKSRVKKLSVTRDQSSIFFLEVYPIPFLGLDLIDPRSSSLCDSGLDPFDYKYSSFYFLTDGRGQPLQVQYKVLN